MNTYVSFEIAKLLKEKGIKIDTEEVIFYIDEINNIEEHQIKNRNILYNTNGFSYIVGDNEYQTYTVEEVLMFLYEKYGVWISVSHKRHSENKHFAYNIKEANEKETYLWGFESPTEAYQEAIKYYLTLK